jgi:glucose-6-phosphate 1-dehydrogenase
MSESASRRTPQTADARRVSFLVLGADGDLTKRLLLPGLASLLELDSTFDVQLIGAGLTDRTNEQWREIAELAFAGKAGAPGNERVLATAEWRTADATDAGALTDLIALCDVPPVIFFALPPAVSSRVCDALADVPLPEGTRFAMEKPFGTSLESARALNAKVAGLLPEHQVHRIDHFLGMATLLNLLGVRFANRVLEPAWDNRSIERVDIVYDEILGLEARGGYYDASGALMDMIQSHLLEVLAFVAMDNPGRVEESALRDAIEDVLRVTSAWDGDPVAASRRARYTAGAVDGRQLPSYADEPGVDPERGTETLAELVVAVDNDRWRGVPFRMRSGKALGHKLTYLQLTFAPLRPLEGLTGDSGPDRLTLDLKSGEVKLELTMNGSNDPFGLEQQTLTVKQDPGQLLPYGEVLRGIFENDPLLSVRGDVAEECWRIVEPVLAAWRNGDVPLEEYAAGSGGPEHWKS